MSLPRSTVETLLALIESSNLSEAEKRAHVFATLGDHGNDEERSWVDSADPSRIAANAATAAFEAAVQAEVQRRQVAAAAAAEVDRQKAAISSAADAQS